MKILLQLCMIIKCYAVFLERATNPQNENVDKAAVEAFCALVNKESEGSHIAIRLLANKIHAPNEREALQTLGVCHYTYSIFRIYLLIYRLIGS